MLEAKGLSAPYFTGAAPFDTERPNSHDTKADFLTEKAATEAAIKQCEDLYDLILSGFGGEGRVDAVAAASICGFVDVNRHYDQQGKRTNSIPEFILKGMIDHSLSFSLGYALHAFQGGLLDKLQHLRDQEREFWSNASRPPKHYARAIALRLARFYCKEVGEFPTSGVSGDGGHPSTDYTRGLQEVYEVLGIQAQVRNMADWAVSQLTEDDIKRPRFGLGSILGLGQASRVPGLLSGSVLPTDE
ncbi:MAG: hypothetical protein JJ894_08725 [Dinoroseobacter sp.]|nr:hypothetical protein [Dinoroseobacter sp.]